MIVKYELGHGGPGVYISNPPVTEEDVETLMKQAAGQAG